MEKKSRKIGIMGGTFDPVHIGHLILGEGAYEQFGLSEVWFMPAGNPPHKQNRTGRATDAQRVEMVKRAIAGNPHFALCMAEMNADGFTYSYRTLETLNRRYPDTEFYFILGADSLFDFHKWREPGRICAACKIVVATRNQVSSEKLDEAIPWGIPETGYAESGYLVRQHPGQDPGRSDGAILSARFRHCIYGGTSFVPPER